ncbi:PH domain-containing protein [Candidatus Sumerlaeota bacterium]|nr:PH domain-containing protein [Candidatus Sumerlaeota bacterium]
MDEAIYEERLKLGIVLKTVYLFTYIVIIASALWALLRNRTVSGWILVIVLMLTAILLFAILPRKYQIFSDRIRIICGLLRVNVPFNDIKALEIRPAHNIYGSFKALRFGTGTGEKCIMLKRKHKMSILIQPMSTERFMEVLNKAMKNKKEE